MLATVAVACDKAETDFPQIGNESTPEVKKVTEIISGRSGSITRAAIADADGAFSWTEGDHIAVHVSNGSSHKYVLTSDEGGSGASVTANEASFKVVYDLGYERDAFAIYPSTIVSQNAANYGQSGSTLDVTLPGSYTLDQLTGTKTPCPMIAVNDASSDTWAFNQLCGLLRLKVSNIPATTKRLEIDFDGKKVWGDFSIAAGVTPGTSVIATETITTADDNHDIITITKDGTDATLGVTSVDLSIPLPTGPYSNITVTTYDALTAGNITFTMNYTFAYSATQAHGTKVTATFPGLFTVSATKKVIFAPGNLQYLGNANGTGTWRFAEHQYDFMGDGPTSGTNYQGNVTVTGYTKYNASADLDVARDLFGWGTSGYNNKYPYLTSTSDGSYYSGSMVDDGANYDWGVYHSASGSSTEKITNGGNYSWRLWTSAEMSYVMKRTNKVYTRSDYKETKQLYCFATLRGVTTNDIKGLVIFPDGWIGDPIRNIKYETPSGGSYENNVFNAEQWTILENMGCVFLPAANIREGSQMKMSNEGHYWSSTIQYTIGEYRGGCLELSNGRILSSATNHRVRRYGQSVRLIRDVN